MKKVNSWEEDIQLHPLLNQKVVLTGTMTNDGIEYEKISPLIHLVNEEKKLNLELQVPEMFWVNKMPGKNPIKQFMPITLSVEWPYRNIWQGTCPSSKLFDFIIEKNEKPIWRWSLEKKFLEVLTSVVIPGGKSIDYTANWEFVSIDIKEEGVYIIKGIFIASNQQIEKKFEIKFAY